MQDSSSFAGCGLWRAQLQKSRNEARRYLADLFDETGVFRLTVAAEPSDYARCFHVFLSHTLKVSQAFPPEKLAADIRSSVRLHRRECGERYRDKPFRQLLTFSLSALHLLGALDDDPLADLIEEQLSVTIPEDLERFGCLNGWAGSGNQAMFIIIFMLHGRDHLGLPLQHLIEEWVEVHRQQQNCFGFWGPDCGMTHLQFQNGYHQHEILEYLGVENPKLEKTLSAVCGIADLEGHFAPYPGGGGCYDYDAVFMLTPEGRIPNEGTRELLFRTAASIVVEQRPDGGFAESIRVRPRSLRNLGMFASHTLAARGNWSLFAERMRYALTLQRPKHDRIQTHWSRYSRRWDESNLWDTWFRMLALARIDVAINPENASRWGFIDYPGIGYHPSLRVKN